MKINVLAEDNADKGIIEVEILHGGVGNWG